MCRNDNSQLDFGKRLAHLVVYPKGVKSSEMIQGETETMRKRQKGFSLIELLIVVAIILIIAAIAIPNLIRARIAANQSSAAATLRTLASAAAMYQSTYQNGYPPNITVLGPATPPNCNTAGLIDNVLAAASAAPGKSGYTFGWQIGAVPVAAAPVGCAAPGYEDMFAVTASPVGLNTGTTYYCVDGTGVIRLSSTAIATTTAGCPNSAMPLANN